MASSGDTYYLEKVTIEDDSDEDFEYEEVPIDSEEEQEIEEDEDLETALRTLKTKQPEATQPASKPASAGPKASSVKKAEVVDDFIRNFLIMMNMTRTLDCFQTEWYELKEKGLLKEDEVVAVPDVYIRNQQLDDTCKELRAELLEAQEIARKATGTWDKFRKERDYHRMHHKRVVQEKNKLVADLKRCKAHQADYEPTLAGLHAKYETAMKEKAMAKLERDKLAKQVEILERELASRRVGTAATGVSEGTNGDVFRKSGTSSDIGRTATKKVIVKKAREYSDPRDSSLPAEDRANPYLTASFPSLALESAVAQKVFKGHSAPISGLALHPKKHVLATASDDCTWKVWALPQCELIMSGDGHQSWVAGIDFHPRGSHLATTSGDGKVKVWDFVQGKCSTSFSEHTQAVWSCAFHDMGDFLATSSLDHTTKLWDLNSERCRQTLRGHVDSVNHVCFQPFSNNVCTCSGDKTVSIWDARVGLCIQTFYGHLNSCSHVCFNMKGDTIASTDADGVVKLWDVRMVSERGEMQMGPYSANKAAFDPSGTSLVVTSDDGTCKVFNVDTLTSMAELRGHEDAVQAIVFEKKGKFFVTSGNDCTYRVWDVPKSG